MLDDEGLSFLLDGSLIPRGLGWIFPVGQRQPDRARLLRGPVQAEARRSSASSRDRGDRRPAPTTARTFPNRLVPPDRGPALRRRRRRRAVPAAHGRGHPPRALLRRRVRPDRPADPRRDRSRSTTGSSATARSCDALPPRLPHPARGPVGGRARASRAGSPRSPGWPRAARSCRAGGRATDGSVASSRAAVPRVSDAARVERRGVGSDGALAVPLAHRWPPSPSACAATASGSSGRTRPPTASSSASTTTSSS